MRWATKLTRSIRPWLPPRTLAGKYLTFALGDEEYGLPVLKVREIIKMMDITAVPQVPRHVKGVINLRGKVIPVVDLRLKFAFAGAGLHRAHLHHRRRGRAGDVDRS